VGERSQEGSQPRKGLWPEGNLEEADLWS